MTATTTLKLPDDLKARIAAAAEQSGKSPHAFMVAAELFRPFWACPDVDIQEPSDCPPRPTTVAEEMDGIIGDAAFPIEYSRE